MSTSSQDISSVLAGLTPHQDPADALSALRKQRIADFLMQDSLSPVAIQQPQAAVGGKYVEARINPLATLGKLAEAVMGKKAATESDRLTAQNYVRGLRDFMDPPAAQQAAAASTQQPNIDGSANAAPNSAQPGTQAVANGNAQQPAVNPMNPFHQPPQLMLRLYHSDPKAFAEAIRGTPDWQNALAATGGDYRKAQALLYADLAKKSALELHNGGAVGIVDPTQPTGYRWVRTPTLSPDMDYTRDPVTGEILEAHNIPGALDALARQRGATTAAEVANTPRMIAQGGGSERLGYVGDAGLGLPPALRGPQAPQSPPLPSIGQPGGQIAAPGASASVREQPTRQYFPKPAPPPAATAPSASSGLPQKSADGTTFDHNLWKGIPQMQIPSTPGQTSNDYQKAILDSAAKKHQALVDKYGEQSAAGVQQLEYLTEAEKALPKAEVGPMSEWLTEHRGKLIEMAPSLAPILGGTGTVTPTLELNKQLTNAALQGARSTFGQRMTQNEVKLQTEEMSPSVGMTCDALVSLIHQAKMKAAYAIQQDKDYSEYHAANGDPNRFESQYNVRRPITRFSAQYDTPQAALERLKQRPELLPDFKRKFGWDPSQ